MKKDGVRPDFKFAGHEATSGRIVRGWQDRLQVLGLTTDQIEYLARCSELHFELGLARNRAKQSPDGYTINFTKSEAFADESHTIAGKDPAFAREIGIFFIADSIGKCELQQTINVESDEETAALEPSIREVVTAKNLEPNMVKAGLQLGVNMHAARQYLSLLLPGQDLEGGSSA